MLKWMELFFLFCFVFFFVFCFLFLDRAFLYNSSLPGVDQLGLRFVRIPLLCLWSAGIPGVHPVPCYFLIASEHQGWFHTLPPWRLTGDGWQWSELGMKRESSTFVKIPGHSMAVVDCFCVTGHRIIWSWLQWAPRWKTGKTKTSNWLNKRWFIGFVQLLNQGHWEILQ